ncbi:hypothetical protein LBMAG55_05160 [Verrucomicrobiota bacterium]|nr:hypothetical protein LBMAG55_05160 [Verrucomicrobiota bacterium]
MELDTVAIVAFSVAGLALYLALEGDRKRRLLDDTPTSKALGVFVGEVELVGQCTRQEPLRSYLADKPCVQYNWMIVEHWERITVEFTEKGIPYPSSVTGSSLVASGGSLVGFYLQDETGFVWIEPAGAELSSRVILNRDIDISDPMYFDKGPAEKVLGSTGRRTFTEHALPIGTTLFIHGRASERPNIVAAQIKYESPAELFIITDKTESAVVANMSCASFCWNVFGTAATFFAFVVLFAGWSLVAPAVEAFLHILDEGRPFSIAMAQLGWATPASLLLGVVVYQLGRGLLWSWMVFNSIIGLRNRVAQAYSLIDVQLKRRADLIPRLVASVQGFREHEAAVQALVATARAQAGTGPLKALAPGLLAISENYPELRAEATFASLSKLLIETEDRIALARGYHNSIATFYNTRIQVVPDRLLADFVKMKPEALFEAEGFGYHPATVAF